MITHNYMVIDRTIINDDITYFARWSSDAVGADCIGAGKTVEDAIKDLRASWPGMTGAEVEQSRRARHGWRGLLLRRINRLIGIA